MVRSPSMLLALVAVVAGSTSVAAQRVEDLSRGAKVRVLLRGGSTRLAYMDTVTNDTIKLHVFDTNPDGNSLSLERGYVTAMQVYQKKPGKGVLRGGLLGLVIGGGAGFIIGALTYSSQNCSIVVCSSESAGALLGIIGGVVGMPVGMALGAGHSEWNDVRVRN